MALPGIGRSTAGAILALAHGQRHPILDGNVKRVLARVFRVEEAPDTTAGARKLWALALDCTPPARVAEYTQAIMDLGATVCTRTNPACTSCPLAIGCGALAAGRVGEIPVARRRAPRRLRQTHMVFALSEGRVMLERRPPRGIWGGLWAPPEFPDAGAAEAFAATRFGPAIASTRRLPPSGTFSRISISISSPGCWNSRGSMARWRRANRGGTNWRRLTRSDCPRPWQDCSRS